jgi:hypothetical protein
MRFFDSKEEVLDIQLTQHGRHLLAKGLCKPVYYAFFDDNVLYDDTHGGGSGDKNSAEPRIQEETPLLRTQYAFTGRDENLYDDLTDDPFSVDPDREIINMYESLNVMPMSLGTTSLDSTKTPAIKVQMLQGEIKNLEYNMTGAARTTGLTAGATSSPSQQLLKIPQIDADIEFSITAYDPTSPELKFEVDEELAPQTVYLDGASIAVGPETILMVLEEDNAPFDYRNFDIEVFEVDSVSLGPFGEETLTPLSFMKKLEMVEDNILIDKKEAEIKAGRINGVQPTLDPSYVEYYFDIFVDEEIDENLVCKSISTMKSNNLFIDVDINCPDLVTPITNPIYASDADDEDCPDY